MAMKVVVVDGAKLPKSVEFPPLDAEKYSWEQYPGLSSEDIADRCWRTDILISLAATIDRATFESLQRLKLVIAAGDACAVLDQAAAREHGVKVLVFPEVDCADAVQARELCKSISRAIDDYIKDFGD